MAAIFEPMGLRDRKPDYLRRLGPEWYQGWAWVHWSMAMDERKRGWLDQGMHAFVRELLLHTCVRQALVCPVYCLMPDHAHFLLMGVSAGSDQRLAVRFFRRAWNADLRRLGFSLQKQPFDHVLDESERNPDAFEDTCAYVLKNPERAGLVENWRAWNWLGSVAPKYPDLDPRSDGWMECFWRIHNTELDRKRGVP